MMAVNVLALILGWFVKEKLKKIEFEAIPKDIRVRVRKSYAEIEEKM